MLEVRRRGPAQLRARAHPGDVARAPGHRRGAGLPGAVDVVARRDVETFADVSASDAVALFLGRAREVDFIVHDDDAALVSSICVRLDGIPLALELAAARLSSMSLSQLHERLDQRFRLLTGGSRNVMARQQTLQALVDWSYGLLSPAEQSVLRRLSVFVGGFTLEAAESVCSSELVDEFDVANVLHSLVAKSLVVADKGRARCGSACSRRSVSTARRSCSTPRETTIDPERA